jgi:hydroxymethylglutaryl-CoA lyase
MGGLFGREREVQVLDRVTVTEVGPRDGLQNFPAAVSTDDKVRMIELLTEAGFTSLEVTSFVRPDVVPQMADAGEVMARMERRGDVDYRALVPNVRGAQRAVEAGVDTLVALLTVTEGYSRKNQNRSVEELIAGAQGVLAYGREVGAAVDIAVGTAFFDPYEGDTPPERVEWVVEQLVAAGASRMCIAASVGMANPAEVNRLCRRLLERWPDVEFGMHLHNTNGMGLANTVAAMDAGIRRFEGAICGIGGGIVMPHGMASAGNSASEDLVHLFSEMGVETGLDVDRVVAAATKVADLLGIEPGSHAARGGRKVDVLRHALQTPREHPV